MKGHTPSDTESGPLIRHGYFVLQVSASREGSASGLNGVLEDLTTGGRLTFDSVADLARRLEVWAEEANPPRAHERPSPPKSE